jgi:hypothetical protein
MIRAKAAKSVSARAKPSVARRPAKPRAKPSRAAKRPKGAPGPERTRKPPVTARVVQGRVPYLEVTVVRPVTENTMVRTFEGVRDTILSSKERRVLVDVSQVSVDLSISDLNDLSKLVGAIGSLLDRLTLVLRLQDIPPEKFFEPSVNNRGVATLVTDDAEEAAYWVTSPLRRIG